MTFRPAIEGLRGVAVLMVVLAHAGVPGLAGGFTGVDVFFVLSGFLITGLLADELERTGRVDYRAFYRRRILRLLPALLVMVAVVGVAVAWLLPAKSMAFQLEAGAWTALWSANLHFIFAGFDYFGPRADDNLFLHAWSLAVEEQFYLLWPWLLATTWAWARARTVVLAAVAATGFAACLWVLAREPTAAYYAMPTRLWQLALGAAACQWVRGGGMAGRGAALLAPAGVILLGATLWAVDGGQAYPGWNALLPSVAAACLVCVACHGRGPVAWLLATPLPRLAGRVSYSWYLWHWPFLAIGPAMGFARPTPAMALSLVLASFLVAWASQAFVEARWRHGVPPVRRPVAWLLAGSVVLAAAMQAGALLAPRLAAQHSPIEAKVLAAIRKPDVYRQEDCDQWYRSDTLVPCERVAAPAPARTIVFIGDSVGTQWMPALEALARARGLRLVVLTKSSCPIVDEPFFYAQINRRFVECERWRDKAVAYVAAGDPAVVVIGSTQYGFSAAQWRDGTSRLVARLSEGRRPVLVLAPTPVLSFHGPHCVVARGRDADGVLEAPDCREPLGAREPAALIGWLRDATPPGSHGAVIYLNDLVCAQGWCRAIDGGMLRYSDERHLDAAFVESLATEFARRFDAALEAADTR